MMRGRSDLSQKKRIITSLCVLGIFLGFLYVYHGSIFGSQSHGASALEYGSRSWRKLGSSYLGGDEDNDSKQDESSTKYGQEDGEEDVIVKSFPVSSILLNLEPCIFFSPPQPKSSKCPLSSDENI